MPSHPLRILFKRLCCALQELPPSFAYKMRSECCKKQKQPADSLTKSDIWQNCLKRPTPIIFLISMQTQRLVSPIWASRVLGLLTEVYMLGYTCRASTDRIMFVYMADDRANVTMVTSRRWCGVLLAQRHPVSQPKLQLPARPVRLEENTNKRHYIHSQTRTNTTPAYGCTS